MRKLAGTMILAMVIVVFAFGPSYAASWYYYGTIKQIEVRPDGTWIRMQRDDNQQMLKKIVDADDPDVDIKKFLATVLTAYSNGWKVSLLYSTDLGGCWKGIKLDQDQQ